MFHLNIDEYAAIIKDSVCVCVYTHAHTHIYTDAENSPISTVMWKYTNQKYNILHVYGKYVYMCKEYFWKDIPETVLVFVSKEGTQGFGERREETNFSLYAIGTCWIMYCRYNVYWKGIKKLFLTLGEKSKKTKQRHWGKNIK